MPQETGRITVILLEDENGKKCVDIIGDGTFSVEDILIIPTQIQDFFSEAISKEQRGK